MKALQAKWSMDETGTWLNLLVDDPRKAQQFVAEKKDKPYTVTLQEWRNKRSLDANAYAWVLLHKLAAKLSISPEELYRQHIRDIGDNAETVLIRKDSVERFLHKWKGRGTGWLAEVHSRSREHPAYSWVTVYTGSSVFDTAQMSRFIGFIIADCRENGIEYLTPKELEQLLARWGT